MIKLCIFLPSTAILKFGTSCLPKMPRQTWQILIRRLLQIRAFPVCNSDNHFVNCSSDNQQFEQRKVFKILEYLEKCFQSVCSLTSCTRELSLDTHELSLETCE